VSPGAYGAAALCALLFGGLTSTHAQAGEPDPFAACERGAAEQPQSYDAYLCFEDAGSAANRRSDAVARLERLEAQSAWATLVLGHMALGSGDMKRAAGHYRQAANRFDWSATTRGSVLARTNLWRIYSNLGDLQAATEQVERVVAAAGSAQDPELRIRARLLEASHLLYTVSGDLQKVDRLLHEVENLQSDAVPRSLREQTLELRVDLYRMLGQQSRALRSIEQLFALRSAAGPSRTLARDALSLAGATVDLAQSPDARPLAVARTRQALELARSVGQELMEARASALLGALLAREQPAESRERFARCLELAKKLELPRQRADCLMRKAEHATGLSNEEAERASAEAVELAAAIDVPLHARAWGSRIRVLWRTRPVREAWRATGPGLEVMESQADHQRRDLESAYLLQANQEMSEWITGRLLEAEPPLVPEAFEMLEHVRARALRSSLDGRTPAPRDAPDIGLAALQRTLRRDQALILFQVGRAVDVYGDPAGGAWALLVTRDQARASRIPDRRALASRVPLLVGLLERRDGSEGPAVVALTRELLGTTLTALPPEVDELLISADGVLHSLPFPVLRERIDGPTLGERFAIANVPSARLWAHWAAGRPPARAPRSLILADPRAAPAAVAASAASAAVRGPAPAPLPGARAEGEWLAHHLGSGAELHTGVQAREHLLKSADLKRYGLVHFAAHAVADETDPERSAVLLAPGDGDDGFLRPSEIEALSLARAVVVLSACQGASGQAIGGEGVFSLSRSFLKAGADAVIASLWPLRDDEALWFFRAFYRNLAGGATLGDALHATRREASATKLPAHAFAGILLIGDGGLAPGLDDTKTSTR
jgi:hypothetical protein